jgi:hypothetical protein
MTMSASEQNQYRGGVLGDAYGSGVQTAEAARPIPSSMTELASAIGDLETAARALAGRISPLLPAGSPFSRVDKQLASEGQGAAPVPRPVRSHFCDELQSRIYQLRSITSSINEMVKGSEL